MKNTKLVLILSLFSMSLFSQTLTFDTTYISFNVSSNVYLLTSEQHFDDLSEQKTVKPIGVDSSDVISLLTSNIKRRKTKEARGVIESYNYKGLSGDAILLKLFSGDTYSKNVIKSIGDAFVGDYKVWIAGVSYDATIGVTGAGNMRLYIPDVANYTILLLSKNSFVVKNYTPESMTFYFVNESNNKRLYLNNDFDSDWRIKSQ